MGSVVSLGAYKASLSNAYPRLYQPGKSIVGSRVVAPGSVWRHTQRNVPYTLASRLLDKIIILGGVEARRTISVASSWLLAQILPVGSAIRLHLSVALPLFSWFGPGCPQVKHSRMGFNCSGCPIYTVLFIHFIFSLSRGNSGFYLCPNTAIKPKCNYSN